MAKDKTESEIIDPTKVDPSTTPREYGKLDKSVDYEHAPVEELADALNELVVIEDRAKYLREIINDNKELHPFIWTTAQGVASALHNLEQDHFSNILIHIVERGGVISKALKSEARRRGIVVPQSRANSYSLTRVGKMSAARAADIATLYASPKNFRAKYDDMAF